MLQSKYSQAKYVALPVVFTYGRYELPNLNKAFQLSGDLLSSYGEL